MTLFITAIGTDSGKTLVSSIFVEALKADYWKPIQAGFPRDLDTVKSLVSNAKSQFHSEAYLLKSPESPHSAAAKENIKISVDKLIKPNTTNHLVVEGAGGVLVPINDQDCIIDIALHLTAEVVLVSNIYLGSINHTLLTVEELKRRHVKVKGIVFNGKENVESERIILLKSGFDCLLRVKQEEKVTPEIVRYYASLLRDKLQIH